MPLFPQPSRSRGRECNLVNIVPLIFTSVKVKSVIVVNVCNHQAYSSHFKPLPVNISALSTDDHFRNRNWFSTDNLYNVLRARLTKLNKQIINKPIFLVMRPIFSVIQSIFHCFMTQPFSHQNLSSLLVNGVTSSVEGYPHLWRGGLILSRKSYLVQTFSVGKKMASIWEVKSYYTHPVMKCGILLQPFVSSTRVIAIKRILKCWWKWWELAPFTLPLKRVRYQDLGNNTRYQISGFV